jgi:hypothetical protein
MPQRWRRFTLSLERYQQQGVYRLRPVWLLSTRRPKQLALITKLRKNSSRMTLDIASKTHRHRRPVADKSFSVSYHPCG